MSLNPGPWVSRWKRWPLLGKSSRRVCRYSFGLGQDDVPRRAVSAASQRIPEFTALSRGLAALKANACDCRAVEEIL